MTTGHRRGFRGRWFRRRFSLLLFNRGQHIIALNEVVDERARISVVQLGLGDARLGKELDQHLVALIACQIETLVRIPANVADVHKIRRLTNIRFGYATLLILASRSTQSKIARQEVFGWRMRWCRRRGQRHRADLIVAQLHRTAVHCRRRRLHCVSALHGRLTGCLSVGGWHWSMWRLLWLLPVPLLLPFPIPRLYCSVYGAKERIALILRDEI